MRKEIIYLPYYKVKTSSGRTFYGEAHISVLVDWYRRLLLSQTVDPGFTSFPGEGIRFRPLADPRSYKNLLEESINKSYNYISKPAFEIKGLRDLIKVILTRKVETKDRVTIEARLMANYAKDVLGLIPGDDIIVESKIYWLPLEVRISKRTISFILPNGERFRVLERFFLEDENARKAVEKELSSKPL